MKYIDAEKLLAEIERRIVNGQDGYGGNLKALIPVITSLQQEQPMPDSTKLIELWNEDKEMLKEKDFRNDPWRLAYNAFMCGFVRGISVKKQERTEVDLEEEAYMRGFAQGAKEERKDLTPLINRLCEAILFEWKNAADLARKILTQIKAREE